MLDVRNKRILARKGVRLHGSEEQEEKGEDEDQRSIDFGSVHSDRDNNKKPTKSNAGLSDRGEKHRRSLFYLNEIQLNWIQRRCR